jgi:transcriptional regulator with XRE-family HTH domain
MESWIVARPGIVQEGFGQLLQSWRRRRRISQLELALRGGVSQGHLSFLESGRAQPSRAMILQISETLQVPLRERNVGLLAGGFAPGYPARPLEDPQMSWLLFAVQKMLTNHEPFPAVAIDRAWNIRLANASFERLTALWGAGIWEAVGGGTPNLMRLFFHPRGIRPDVVNWAAIARLLWHRAEREAEAEAGEELRQLLAELRPYQDRSLWPEGEEVTLLPVLPLEIARGGVRVSLFSVISTFGTAQDISADELRIESLFPADAATEELLRSGGGKGG